jgi:xylose isomerase
MLTTESLKTIAARIKAEDVNPQPTSNKQELLGTVINL